MNHQRLVEFSTSNDRKHEKSSDTNEINDEDCDDDDIETNDDEDDEDNDSDANMMMKRQNTNIKPNEPIIVRNETIIVSQEKPIIPHDIDDQTNVKFTEEQQIKRLRKRKRRRRRRRRKSVTNQITFAVNKDASVNINAEKVMPQSFSNTDESVLHTATNSFASKKHNANMGLRVRRAILWIKVDAINQNGQYKKWTTARRLNYSTNTKRQFTLWVFHIVEPVCKSKSNSRRVMCCSNL